MFQVPRNMLTIDGRGLVFGTQTVLAKLDSEGCLDVERDQKRVLGLLSLAYKQPAPDWVITKLSAAASLWNRGDKGNAALRLVWMGLADVEGDSDSMAKVAAAEREWVSDFHQQHGTDPYPGSGYRHYRPPYAIYRP